jgi:hypothetical protein
VMDRIHLGQDRHQWWDLVNMTMNLSVPWQAGYLSTWITISFSRRTLFHEANILWFKMLMYPTQIWYTVRKSKNDPMKSHYAIWPIKWFTRTEYISISPMCVLESIINTEWATKGTTMTKPHPTQSLTINHVTHTGGTVTHRAPIWRLVTLHPSVTILHSSFPWASINITSYENNYHAPAPFSPLKRGKQHNFWHAEDE